MGLGGVDYEWHVGEEETDRLLTAEQVGMQLLSGRYAHEWGGGGWEQSSATLLHLRRRSQKWQSDVIVIVTHKLVLFILSTSRATRGGGECRQVGRKRGYLGNINTH